MNNKKICVVGAGAWGKNHVKTLHRLNSLGGVVDSSLENLNQIKEPTFGVKLELVSGPGLINIKDKVSIL